MTLADFLYVLIICFTGSVCFIFGSIMRKEDINEETRKKINSLQGIIDNQNKYIHFLQIELIEERRSKINVTINDSKEVSYED